VLYWKKKLSIGLGTATTVGQTYMTFWVYVRFHMLSQNEYSKTLTSCSRILHSPWFRILFVWSQPNAHKNMFPGLYTIVRWSWQKWKIRILLQLLVVSSCLSICAFIKMHWHIPNLGRIGQKSQTLYKMTCRHTYMWFIFIMKPDKVLRGTP
jgi:hypothetical protein